MFLIIYKNGTVQQTNMSPRIFYGSDEIATVITTEGKSLFYTVDENFLRHEVIHIEQVPLPEEKIDIDKFKDDLYMERRGNINNE